MTKFEEVVMNRRGSFQGNTTRARSYRSRRGSMIGKVVMLIVQDAAPVRELVSKLAQRGADIALVCVCVQVSQQVVRLIKEEVNHVGRRFLHIQARPGDDQAAEQAVGTIVAELRRIDVFIDLSASRAQPTGERGTSAIETFFSGWPVTGAAIREVAR